MNIRNTAETDVRLSREPTYYLPITRVYERDQDGRDKAISHCAAVVS